jgi:hypothetical protein
MSLDNDHHPTQPLTDPQGTQVEIDRDLVPLVERLWRVGFETISCCQDSGEAIQRIVHFSPHLADEARRQLGYAQVDFTVESGLAFLTGIANAGPRDDFYVRMVHWAAPNAWHVTARPDDVATDDETQPSEFDLWSLQVSFPWSDLDEIVRRLDAYERRELSPPGPIDWSSIEISEDQI